MNIEKINVGGNLYDICDAKARAMISDEYNPGKEYVEGDICIQDNKVYRAKADTTGVWDSTKWEEKPLAEIIGEQNSKIQVPDYKNKRPIGSDNYTAPEDGYVRIQNQLTGHLVPLGTNVSAQIKINEETAYFFLIRIEESSSYLAIDSGLYPVKKGDSIEFLHLGSDTADRYFYPVL